MAGRRVEKVLTAAFVRAARTPGKFYDGQGLFLRVHQNGSRFWVQRIVIRGKRCDLGLGSPGLVSLSEARERALANRKLAREGGDPMQARQAAARVMTFEEAAREVHRLHLPTWRSKRHAALVLSSLETYAFPRLGPLRLPDVTTADVLAVLTPIWTSKAVTARRVHQRVSAVLKWGMAQGWRPDNPAETVLQALPRPDVTRTPRKALPYSAVAACLAAVRASKAGLSPQLAIEFAALTAARSGEVREATWSEIDLNAGVWEVPAARMKMARPHRVPLSARALEVLRQAQDLGNGEGFVFLGTRRGRPLSDTTLSRRVKDVGFDADLHGFRTSFRTWAQERTDFPREVAEFALAHVVGDAAERAYARSDLFEKRREMMEAWAKFLEKPKVAT